MKHYRILVFTSLLVGSLCSAIELSAQSLKDSLNVSDLSIPPIPSVPQLPALNKPILSNFGLSAGAAIGYVPLIDSSSLSSGYTKSYFIQSSANIFGLPFNFNYSSASNISVVPQTFNYQQFHFAFDPQALLENFKSQMSAKLIAELQAQQEKITSYHYGDSIALYEKIKDTLNDLNYQARINRYQDSLRIFAEKEKNNVPYDTLQKEAMDKEMHAYEEYQKVFTGLMRYQEKFNDLQQEFIKDSALIMQNVAKVQSIADKSQLKQLSAELGSPLSSKLAALNFKQASIGTQLFTNSELTFYNYFSKGFTTTFNDGKYIVKAAALTNSIGFTNPLAVTDSAIMPSGFQKNILLVGAGIGDLEENYSLVTASFIHSKDELDGSVDRNKGLLSYLQQISVADNVKVQLEVGKTMMHAANDENSKNQFSDILSKSAGFASVKYRFPKITAQTELESSYIGEAYFTEGNPLLQPGTFNAAVGWKQELFHSKLLIDYKINASHFLGENSGRNWYQIAQISYRLGKWGSVSCLISPYQFNYYVAQADYLSSSNANFINLNASLNIPLHKQIVYTSFNFSNYASQSTLSDTVFSNTTRHLSAFATTSFGKYHLNLIGNYFLPIKGSSSTYFINSMELTGTAFSNKTITISVGPKWLGYDSFSDQLGGKMQASISMGKHFNWNGLVEKYFNIESDKMGYQSTILFSTDLAFKL